MRARCGGCHGKGLPELAASCRERRGSEGLEAFLARHHARDPEERRRILAELAGCVATPRPPG